jgi:hypothetical protein
MNKTGGTGRSFKLFRTKMTPRLREDLEKCRFAETRFQNLLAACKADPKGPRTLRGVIRFYILLQRDLKRQLDEQLDPRSHG